MPREEDGEIRQRRIGSQLDKRDLRWRVCKSKRTLEQYGDGWVLPSSWNIDASDLCVTDRDLLFGMFAIIGLILRFQCISERKLTRLTLSQPRSISFLIGQSSTLTQKTSILCSPSSYLAIPRTSDNIQSTVDVNILTNSFNFQILVMTNLFLDREVPLAS
jgi:hypothetical protein